MWLLRALRSFHPAHRLSLLAHSQRSPLLRSLVAALAIVLLISGGLVAVTAHPTGAASALSNARNQDYLALGDSIAFGYNPLLDPRNANNFIGYPTPVAAALNLKLTNPACSGATSSYLVSLSGADWTCIHYRTYHPLHVNYSASQLDYAVWFLRSHPNTRLVTINIGVNDIFRMESQCGGSTICVQNRLPGVLAILSNNLNIIYGAIRHTAQYHYQLVALTYYSTNYKDPVRTGIIKAMDQVIADRTRAWGGLVANGFQAFEAASARYHGDPCAAGLIIRVSATACDLHPSVKGRDVLAQTILAVLRHTGSSSAAA